MKLPASFLAALAGSALIFTPHSGAGERARMIEPSWSLPFQGRPELIEAQVLPLRQLIAIVQSQRGGSFVDVVGGLEQHGDRAFYVFRWRYPNGVEENLRVDASSGQVVGR